MSRGLLAGLGVVLLALGSIGLLVTPTLAAVPPQGGQDAYDLPLPAFDLFSYRSAASDAGRSETEAALARNYGGTWTVYAWNPQSASPGEMYGSGVDLAAGPFSADEVRAQAERVIQANGEALRADLAGLRFLQVTGAPPVTDAPDGVRRAGKWAAHFQQSYHGLDVVGGRVHLTFTDTGRLFALGSTYYRDIAVDWNPAITADEAKEIARRALPYNAATDSIGSAARLLILPVPQSENAVEHHLVWETRVTTQEPLGIWVTRVDAHRGEILERTNDISFADYIGNDVGQVERTSHCDGSHQETFPYVHVAVFGVGNTYADANGYWVVPYGGGSPNTLYSRLFSPYVDVQNMQGSYAGVFATVYPGVHFQVTFDDSNSRADERDVFRTVQDLHDFFQTFAPGFGFTNQMVTARVNINNTCNAFYNGNAINFYQAGSGCANTGQMMDVVAHEYGHGVQEAILGGQGGEGLGEGNGDVLGFLMSGESMIFRGWNNCSSGIRDADNSLVYPDDVVGQEIHYAGQVIAGFHWDAMQDQIAEYGAWGRYSTAWDWHWGRVLQLPMTQPAQVLATFIANDDDGNLANGTPQFNAYCRGATRHGFTCPSVTLPLAAGACDQYYQAPQGYTLNQTNNYWSVVGVAPSSGDDKDISVYTAGYGALLASSVGTVGTDFVVGDFNHNPTGIYQPYVHYGAATSPFVTEWDSGPDAITLGVDIFGSVGGAGGNCGLVRVWDVFLTAGQSYSFGLRHDGGSADMRLSLFRNPAAAPYWTGRSSAVFELTAGTSQLYTAPASDWYGVVVFNNAEGTPSEGYYTLRVQDAPVAMASAECQSWSSSPRMFGFAQGLVYWTGVAVNPSGADDKDIALYADPGGTGSALASSAGVVGTDFIVGDFNHNATGTYYPRVSYGSTSANYVVEWDSGTDTVYPGLDVNGSVGGGTGGCGLIQVSDIYLNEGQTVRFLLLTGGGADIRMALFRNPSDGTYWASRGSAEFEAGNFDGRTYTAPASDWYGVVVFNNSPDSPAGYYTLKVRDFPATLADATCLTPSTVPQIFNFTQATPYWSAVAINPTGADDKDVWIFDNPDGLGAPLGYSNGVEGTDFMIGDFNHNALGTYYPLATFGASPTDYVLEWDGGPDIFPIGPTVEGTVGGLAGDCQLVKVWDLFLEAGQNYQFVLDATGDADLRLSLFRNPDSAPYWADRFSAEFETTPAGTPYGYEAPASDYYGLVVFNASPDSPAGAYTLRIESPAAVPEETADAEPGVRFQNPYPVGSPILLRAGDDDAGSIVGIYNVQGQLVRTLLHEPVGRAGRQVAWDGRTDSGTRLGSGIYFLRARLGAGNFNRTLYLTR